MTEKDRLWRTGHPVCAHGVAERWARPGRLLQTQSRQESDGRCPSQDARPRQLRNTDMEPPCLGRYRQRLPASRRLASPGGAPPGEPALFCRRKTPETMHAQSSHLWKVGPSERIRPAGLRPTA